MPIRKVKGGYQWGESGKVYPNRTGAERQAQAAYASGYKGYQNGGLASIPGYKEGNVVGAPFGSSTWNTGFGSNPIGGSDYSSPSFGGIWNLFPSPMSFAYPSSYNRHFYRDRGGKVRKFQTRKKINEYYKGDED